MTPCAQYFDIEKISDHPVPWPYTHLTQFFLVIWVYTLPICLVPTYGFGGVHTKPARFLMLYHACLMLRCIMCRVCGVQHTLP